MFDKNPQCAGTPAEAIEAIEDAVLRAIFGPDRSEPPGPSVQIPAPAPGQRLVYADRDGKVWVLDADDDALTGGPLDPNEARELAQRLEAAAYAADGGE